MTIHECWKAKRPLHWSLICDSCDMTASNYDDVIDPYLRDGILLSGHNSKISNCQKHRSYFQLLIYSWLLSCIYYVHLTHWIRKTTKKLLRMDKRSERGKERSQLIFEAMTRQWKVEVTPLTQTVLSAYPMPMSSKHTPSKLPSIQVS